MMQLIKNLSPVELVIILFVLTSLFGGKRLMNIARSGGETFKEVKKIKKTIEETAKEVKE